MSLLPFQEDSENLVPPQCMFRCRNLCVPIANYPICRDYEYFLPPINPAHSLISGNGHISESQKKSFLFLVGRIRRKSKLYDYKSMRMAFAFLLTYSETHSWDSAILLFVKICIVYIEILQKKTEHKTSQYYFVQHSITNKYYTYPNINIISETLPSRAILLLLNNNLLKLDRPLVPPRLEGQQARS